MPFETRWDGDVRLALCVQDGGQVAVSLSVVGHSGGYLSRGVMSLGCSFLSDYLDDCPPHKMLYAYRAGCFKGEAEHVIYSMEKLDWMVDDDGNPQWRVTEGDRSWSDFESSDELLHRVQSLYEQPSVKDKDQRIPIFEHTSGIVFICGANEYGFDEMMFELLGEKRAPTCGMLTNIGCRVFLFGSVDDIPIEKQGSLILSSDEEGSEEEGSEEEGSEEESEDEDAGEEFRSGKYAKLEGTFFGALELGAWTSFTRFEASDHCSKHMHSWAFGDVCGENLVIIRILRGEKAGGASATLQKCYVALLWDLSSDNWAYRTLPQLGPPTADYTDQPDVLARFESKLRKFSPPSVAAALSQAARASNSAKKARHS